MRAREAICPRLHIYEALKYNLLMLRLNKVKVCVCACVFLLNVKMYNFCTIFCLAIFLVNILGVIKLGRGPSSKKLGNLIKV